MSNRTTNILAVCILIFVFVIAFFSVKDDSVTMDEVAHLPAGYSYLTQKDMRLNPEHPPLLKDLAAIPLLFIKDMNFPSEIKAWKEDVNSQWDFGFYFLYHMGNPVDKMIFWGRIPMISILILLGFYIFKWARELFGNKAGLLALFLFSFSPTLLAHGRLVTTDVGATTGIAIATYYFLKALKLPTKKNIVLAGVSFGIAELCKFSVILLVPFFGLIGLVWWLTKSGTFLHPEAERSSLRGSPALSSALVLGQTIKIVFSVFLIGFLLIWPVYQFHTWNYPAARQVSDTKFNLGGTLDFVKKPIVWASDKPILRPYALYLTGLSMVFLRVTGGNTTYFLGEVSNLGWRNYFPIVYLIKEPLATHILTLIALLYVARAIKRPPHQSRFRRDGAGLVQHRALLWCWAFWKGAKNRIVNWLKLHFAEFSMLTFIGIYWVVSITGNLNIGVRHLLPVFPFTILLVSGVTINWLKEPYLRLKYSLMGLLILWQAVSVISVYPHFLAYFNESVGGSGSGFKYAVDSNLDWGQDLKRLTKWVEINGINKIYIDYFGGGDPEYYLGTKYAPWWGTKDPKELAGGSYLAVSATFLQQGRGKVIPTLKQPEGYYRWLNKFTPVTKIGHSIFVYRID